MSEFDLSNNTASLLSNVSEREVIIDTGMEDTVFVEGFTVADPEVTESSSSAPEVMTSTAPPRTSQITALEDKFIKKTRNDLTISPVTVIKFTTKVTSFHDSILHIATDQSGNTTIPPLTTGEITVSEPRLTVDSINPYRFKTNTVEDSSSEISSDKFNPIQADVLQNNTSEISFASSIPPEQFFSSHNSTPKITNVLNNSATKIWSDLLQTETQLEIDFQITDLPPGQLAEATITGLDDSGIPNAGTIEIDHDANGVGWFIDSTPEENEEFAMESGGAEGAGGEYYLLAVAESEASGKYDLLTTVLHELAHLYGFIDGYAGFDANVETENGTTKFIGDDFEATLDGEHLDKEAHPHDLMNTHPAPGIRKLPSQLDVEILQAILSEQSTVNSQQLTVNSQQSTEDLDAALSSDPLLAIANGDFSISDTTTDSFAWDTRGASGIENGQAVLTEDSPFLSNFTQTFTVPEDAKTLQFKLIETELGTSEFAPPRCF